MLLFEPSLCSFYQLVASLSEAPAASLVFASEILLSSYCTTLERGFALEVFIFTTQVKEFWTSNVFKVSFKTISNFTVSSFRLFLMLVHREDVSEKVLNIPSVTIQHVSCTAELSLWMRQNGLKAKPDQFY